MGLNRQEGTTPLLFIIRIQIKAPQLQGVVGYYLYSLHYHDAQDEGDVRLYVRYDLLVQDVGGVHLYVHYGHDDHLFKDEGDVPALHILPASLSTHVQKV